jgi:hypothetical protein
MEQLLYFDTSVLQYAVPAKINLDLLCNAIVVNNTGNIICLIDDEPLQPGDSKTIGGNRGEILTGRHEIGFTTVGMAVVPSPIIQSAFVTQKFYINPPKGSQLML